MFWTKKAFIVFIYLDVWSKLDELGKKSILYGTSAGSLPDDSISGWKDKSYPHLSSEKQTITDLKNLADR